MRKRVFLPFLFVLFPAGLFLLFFFLFSGPPPNILFVVLDAARADRFSCYGYEKNTTPCIDAIARKGVVFLNNISQATYTRASVPRILFSRYFTKDVFQIIMLDRRISYETPKTVFQDFDREQIFLPTLLAREGYRTALFHNHPWFSEDSYKAQQFQERFDFPSSMDFPMEEKIISSVMEWIEKKGRKKFFAYVHIMSPHCPYPPKEEDQEFLAGEDPAAVVSVKEKFSTHSPASTSAGGWSRDELRILQGIYNSNLKHSDKWIGILYKKIEDLGLAENTLVVITSDHGEGLGEHGHIQHGDIPWECQARVPLLFSYPPRLPQGLKVTGLSESVDIMPTVLDICGIDLPAGKKLDGESLLGAISNPGRGKETVYTLYPRGVRTERYKYLFKEDQLYDLKTDPGETKNIASLEPAVMARLKEKYIETMKPYKKRFENAVTKSPPDHPFFYTMEGFSISPRTLLGKFKEAGASSISKEGSKKRKRWLMKKYGQSGLCCTPGLKASPVLTLAARVPNAKYKVDLYMEAPGLLPASPSPLRLRYRFHPEAPFSRPIGISPAKSLNKKTSAFYLNLGDAEVREERLALELFYEPPVKRHWLIRKVQFTPLEIPQKGAAKKRTAAEEKKRRESLKALGYYFE